MLRAVVADVTCDCAPATVVVNVPPCDSMSVTNELNVWPTIVDKPVSCDTSSFDKSRPSPASKPAIDGKAMLLTLSDFVAVAAVLVTFVVSASDATPSDNACPSTLIDPSALAVTDVRGADVALATNVGPVIDPTPEIGTDTFTPGTFFVWFGVMVVFPIAPVWLVAAGTIVMVASGELLVVLVVADTLPTCAQAVPLVTRTKVRLDVA